MSARTWRIAGVAAALLLLVAGWFALVNPTLADAAALDTEAASQQAASDQLESRISLLKKQSEELPAQEAILASIQQRMPSDAALPTLIRNLTTVANSANVTVAAVTPGRPTPVEPPAPPAPPAPQAEGEEPADADAESADADSASSTSDSSAAVPAGPKVQAVSLNITACGTFAQLRSYLRALETMKRVVAVNGLQLSRGSCAEGSPETDLTAAIQANVFTLANPNAAGTTGDGTTSASAADAAATTEGAQS
ncbi:MAG TPA: GspMb/PilO family protein [Candidatus Nanopelagicales bacterium]